MALFKISRGGENNLPTTITDGWAYFTPDTKGFFIDVKSNIGSQQFNERIEINEKDICYYLTISGAQLDSSQNYYYTLSKIHSGINYDILVELDDRQFTQINELFNYRSMAQKLMIEYELLVNNAQMKFHIEGLDTTETLYLKLSFIPKKKTITTFSTMVDGSVGMGSLNFYAGSTWREYVANPLDAGYSWEINSDNHVQVSYEHPWYGHLTAVNSTVSADDFIIPGRMYEFSSISSCCFVAGTNVLMADNNSKHIEDIVVGEKVVSYNIDTGEQYETTVIGVIENKKSIYMAEITFDTGITLTMTDYHPIYTSSGWKSLTGYLGYDILEVGQLAKTANGWSEILKIEQYQNAEPITTYTLNVADDSELNNNDIDNHDNFYANGIVVHNAACPE